MVTLVVWTLIALGASALVIVVAGGAGAGERVGSLRTFLSDVRAGVEAWRSRRSGATAVQPEPEPVDATFDEFFAAAEVDDDAYLQLDELADTLLRARELATRGVGLVRH